MQHTLIFDETESKRRKSYGMTRAADRYPDLLNQARDAAKYLAHIDPNGETNADEVGEELARRGYPDCLGAAAGSIFKTKEWRFTGRFVNSKRVSNHSRLLRVWALIK